jgi:uncharacterized membrane protein YkvA (DUF1232 family)
LKIRKEIDAANSCAAIPMRLPRNSELADESPVITDSQMSSIEAQRCHMEIDGQNRLKRMRRTLNTQTRQLLNEFHLILRALGHPGVPWFPKLICGCTVLYVVSPIQLIPNFIPILGQLDDVLVVGLAIRILKKYAPRIVLDEYQNGSELNFQTFRRRRNYNALSTEMGLNGEERWLTSPQHRGVFFADRGHEAKLY